MILHWNVNAGKDGKHAVAYGMYLLGTFTALIIFSLLALHHLPVWHKFKGKAKRHPHPDEHHP